MEPIKISGPISILRLENTKINKILYIINDVHTIIDEQTECIEPLAKRIKTYLIENFIQKKNNKQQYDFFLEIFPSSIYDYKNYTLPTYINDIQVLFSKLINTDNKHIIKYSKYFNNIRFHYIDVRDYIGYDLLLSKLPKLLENTKNINYNSKEFKIQIIELIEFLNKIKNIFVNLTILINKQKHNIPPDKPNLLMQNKSNIFIIKYILNKIRTKYNDNTLQIKLNNIMNTLLQYYEKQIILLLNDLIKHVQKINNHATYIPVYVLNNDNSQIYNYFNTDINLIHNYVSELFLNTNKLNILMIKYCSVIMDIYFLRRLLDKPYITNAVVYTGLNHGNFYTYCLVKYFNFQITYCSNNKYKINKLNNILQNVKLVNTQTKKSYENTVTKILTPSKMIQCINITNMPILFD